MVSQFSLSLSSVSVSGSTVRSRMGASDWGGQREGVNDLRFEGEGESLRVCATGREFEGRGDSE
jgi:hypothetical protein